MSLTLTLTPVSITLAPGASQQLVPVFGKTPYTLTLQPGGSGGTLDPVTGIYTAPAILSGADAVLVTDADGNTSQSDIVIQNPVIVLPENTPVNAGGSFTFAPSGGTAPYAFQVLPGGAGGTIDPVSGVYVAPVTPGIDTIQVTDALGDSAECDLIVDTLPLQLLPPYLAVGRFMTVPFQAIGGDPAFSEDGSNTPIYRYAVDSGPGSIDENGNYTSEGETGIAVLKAYDSQGVAASSIVKVGSPLQLFCDILEQQMGFEPGRVWIWDQKINEPIDEFMFIVVKVLNPRCFGNTNRQEPDDTGLNQIQSSYMNVQLQVEVKSRSTEAFDRLGEVIQALNSIYSQQQQELNSFKVFPVSKNIVDMSGEDGAAIPYRFVLSATFQYTETTITRAAPYFDNFGTTSVTTDP